MHQTRAAILEQDFYKSPVPASLSDAFAVLCRHFGHTAKPVSEAFRMDKRAAVNALDGKAGVPVISKALKARQKAADDHWDQYIALGQMLFGESLDQYEERKLQRIIESTHNEISTLEARRARRRNLAESSATVAREWDRLAG